MPNPKRQHSKQRSRKRSANWKTRVPGLGPCSNCKRMVIPHRVCPFCGAYKGKPIVDMTVKEKKKP